METQPLNYHGKYVTLASDSKSAHIGALMLESEYDTEEVKRKSTPFPASGKESRLGVENKTGLCICSELPLLGLLLGLDRPSRIDSGSTPTIYIESGQSCLDSPCPPIQGAIIVTGLHKVIRENEALIFTFPEPLSGLTWYECS